MTDEIRTVEDIVKLGAIDAEFFNRFFFPKTFRQDSPPFHKEMDNLLDSHDRLVNMIVYRGGAKTTKLRSFVARRISYGISRTILYIGKSQGHAQRSLRWLRKQIEKNKRWTDIYQLSQGDKWTDEEMNVVHGIEDEKIWIVAMGITGSVRGLNFDDFRPDLIIVDDVIDDENSSTLEQRTKIENLILGSVKESLAPASEAPEAKMVILQTPLDFGDFSQKALKDGEFKSVVFPCWTKETAELPPQDRKSAWEARWSTETLQKEREAAIARNKLSIFAREKECKLITPETADFRQEWIKYFGDGEEEPEPELSKLWIEIAIDPVPPPSDKQIKQGLGKKDFEAFAVVGRYGGKYYVLETVANKGHEPNWTVATFFELCLRWKPRKIIVEAVAYQRTLVWLLKEAMKVRGRYWVVEPLTDKRSKPDRIKDGLSGVLAAGQIFFRRKQITLVDQIIHHPNVAHDDEIESLAVASASLQTGDFTGIPGGSDDDEKDIEELEFGGAP